jgi:cytoskeleton protein RodZ
MTDSADASNASPGEILRGARELYGWSLEEVAAELNLLPDVVEALEADDYRDIAGWTYAVGYLRNYARLAGVSIEQSIADREELLPPKEDGPGTMTEGTSHRPQPVPIQYRWVVTAVVLLLVIGGLYTAYLNRASDVERVRVDLAEESRSQMGAETSGAAAATGSREEAPAQPALAVTLTATDEGATAELNAATSAMDRPADGQELPGEAATPPVEPQTLADLSAPIVEQVATLAAEPSEKSADPEKEEKKEKKKKVVASAATVKVSESKVEKKSESVSTSSSASRTNTAENSSTTSPKQQVANQNQSSVTASVEQRLLNPKFSTALSSTGDSEESASTLPLTAESRGITLKVQENTHVVVWDRDNVELFRRYVGGGKVVSLSGKPPFTLLVSYPEGATVVYGGREFRIPVGKSGRNAKVRVGR